MHPTILIPLMLIGSNVESNRVQKKRLHDERRHTSENETRRPNDPYSSDRSTWASMSSIIIALLSNEFWSTVDKAPKSTLKQGRFSFSNEHAGSNKAKGHGSKMSNATSGRNTIPRPRTSLSAQKGWRFVLGAYR
jgi:hypothetical protein